MSVTLPLTAEFLSIGDLELALVKKVGYGAIAGIKMRVQVRSTLWKYNRGKFSVISDKMAQFPLQNGLQPCGMLTLKLGLIKGFSGLAVAT